MIKFYKLHCSQCAYKRRAYACGKKSIIPLPRLWIYIQNGEHRSSPTKNECLESNGCNECAVLHASQEQSW